MIEGIFALSGAIVGAVIAGVISIRVTKLQHKAEMSRFFIEKQYEILCLVLEFVSIILDIHGEKEFIMEDETVSFEEQCKHLAKLEREFRPYLPLVFDNKDVKFIEEICQALYKGEWGKKEYWQTEFTMHIDELNKFTDKVRQEYFNKKL